MSSRASDRKSAAVFLAPFMTMFTLFFIVPIGYALYLTNIEAHKLEVWCLYCVSSQIIIALITLLAIFWAFFGKPRRQPA